MKKYILKALQFLNVLDVNNNASITNLLVIAATVYLGINPDDIVAIAGAGLALLNYGHKRHEATQFLKEKLKDVSKETVKELTDKLNDVNNHVNDIEGKVKDEVTKVLEPLKQETEIAKNEIATIKQQTKDVLDEVSKSKLVSALKPR